VNVFKDSVLTREEKFMGLDLLDANVPLLKQGRMINWLAS